MNFCPNKSHPDWLYIVENSDETTAYKLYIKESFNIPSKAKIDEYLKKDTIDKKELQATNVVPITPDTQWLKDKLGMSDNDILTVKGLIEGDALGQFMEDGKILLSEFSDDATMYHEAFHRVFNMYLTEAEKKVLFDELKNTKNFTELFNKYKELYKGESETTVMEEILAEEFSDYVLNETKDTSILGKLFKFLKTLLGLNNSEIKDLYSKINKGDFKGKPVISQYFKGRKRLLTLGGYQLNSETESMVMSSLDQMFLQKVFAENPFNLFENKVDITGTYSDIIKDLRLMLYQTYKATKDAALWDLSDALGKDPKTLIKAHQERLSTHYKILVEEDIVEEDNVEGRNALDIRSSIEFDTKTSIPEVINMMLGSLVKKDKKGNFVKNKLGFYEQADVMKLRSVLINNLWGYTDINEMIERIGDLAFKYPELFDVINILDGGESEYKFNPDKQYLQRLRNKFTQAFAKTKYNFLLQLVEEGSVIKLMDANSDQITDKIKTEWKNNFIKKHSGKTKDQIIEDLRKSGPKGELDYSKFIASNLGIEFTEEKDYIESFKRLETLKGEVLKGLNSIEDWTKIYDKDSGVGLGALAITESKNRDIIDLQIINTEGKSVYGISLNTYQSLMINKINNIIQKFPSENGEVNPEREEALRKELPHLFNVYTKNSIWLKRILEENNLLVNNLFDGSKFEEDAKGFQQLKETDLLATFFNTVKQGYNLSLKHSDRSMYPTYSWTNKTLAINTFSKDTAIERAIPIFKGYIEDLRNGMKLKGSFQYYNENSKTPTILGDILTKEELAADNLSDTFLESKIKGYLNREIYKNLNLFNEWKLLEKYNKKIIGIPEEALEPNSYGTPENYVGVGTVNMIISHIEETKLFIGNPAFYKNASDFFKRLNVQTSTGEIFIVNEETNEYVEQLNSEDLITLDKETFQYSKFNETTQTDGTLTELVITEKKFVSAVINDIKTMIETGVKQDFPDMSQEEIDKKVNMYLSSYTNYDENDGISIMNIFALRESMVRVGEWDDKHQNVFKEEMKALQGKPAYEIPVGVKPNEVSNWFEKTYKPFTQQKYQYVGPNYGMPKSEYESIPDEQRLGATALRKTSYFQLMPSNVKGTALETLMKFMLKEGVDVVHMGSAAKVGARELRDFFTSEGEINTDEITPEQKGYLDFRYFKKQVEISPKEKVNITSSTQGRKNIIEGLFNNGVPKDIKLTKEEFNTLTEEKKKELSPVYKLSTDYQSLQSQLILREINNFLRTLGIKDMKFTDESYEALSIILEDAAKERNSPDNIVDAVAQWANDYFYIETLPNSEKIQNLLNSLITNKILVQKRPGAAMPQAPVTGFTKAQFKDNKLVGSDYLEFYSPVLDSEGNIIEIIPAEIIMPFPVSWLNKATAMAFADPDYKGGRSVNGVVDYINQKVDNGTLYFEMKGLRIPNQQLSSNDIFRVKKFSYPQYQQSVIVPSEIVAKTGGDFDIDKMQLYWYHTNPQFKPLKMLTDENSTVKKRAAELLKDAKAINYLYPGDERPETIKEYFDSLDKVITANKELIKETLISDPEAYVLIQIRNDIKDRLSRKKDNYNQNLLNINLLGQINAELHSMMSIKDYELEIETAKATKEKIISMIAEDIKDLPIELQNVTKVLDNELLNLERELILNPLQSKTLLMPVADTELGSIADKLVPVKERKKEWSDILNVLTKVRTYIDFVGGKAGVGQYATWITHLALAETFGFKVNPTFNKELDSDGEVVTASTQLRFEGLEDKYEMGGIFDAKKYEIAAKLSELLTSQVDNVKDPYAVSLQIVEQTNNTIAYAILRGVPLETIIDFLSQPIIVDYLKAQRINESQIIKATGRKSKDNPEGKELSKDDLISRVKSKYGGDSKDFEKGVSVTEQMLKGNANQSLMLDVFLNLQDQSIAYSRVKNYLSPDTQFIKNMADAKSTIIDLKNEVEFNDIVSQEYIQKAVGPASLLNGFFEGRELYYDLYKNLFLTETSDIAPAYESMRKDYLMSIRGKDKKSKASSLLSQEFVNYLLQKYYLEDTDFQRIMYTNSIPKQVIELKKKYPDNLFLRELMPIIGSSKWYIQGKTYKFDNLKAFMLKLVTDENNLLISSLDELYEQEPAFVEDLVKYNIVQGGTKLGPYQLNKFMSYNLMKPALNKLLFAPVSSADVFDFFPKFISVYTTGLPSKGMAESRRLSFYKKDKTVYVNGKPVQSVGEPYKWTNYRHNIGSVLEPNSLPREEMLTQPTVQTFQREYTPENITTLKPNEVFVFGANTAGGHGGGTAGLAQRGTASSNYTALPIGTKGKWSEYGIVDKLMQGTEGKSFGIVTKAASITGTSLKIGSRRSVSLNRIEESINALIKTANENPNLKFLVTKFGTNMAGFTIEEMKSLLVNKTLPDNIILPKEFEVRTTQPTVQDKAAKNREIGNQCKLG